MLGDALGECAQLEIIRGSHFELFKTYDVLYKHLRPHINFLEKDGKWACIHEMSITQQISQPSLILRFDKIACFSWIDTTHTKWDIHFSFMASTSYPCTYCKYF